MNKRIAIYIAGNTTGGAFPGFAGVLVEQIALVNSDLESLTATVDGKADQSAVDALSSP